MKNKKDFFEIAFETSMMCLSISVLIFTIALIIKMFLD